MNPREQGFLLLTSQLGDPERKPLSVAQFRQLAFRAANMEPASGTRQLNIADLQKLGYDKTQALRILNLLESKIQLNRYLEKGAQQDCIPITRVSAGYPLLVRRALGLDSPGCLWAKGDLQLLASPCVALVGSREPLPENADFAAQVGYQAACQGYTLVSGNARGSDRIAQRACLEQGGHVICVVADELYSHPLQKRILYLSEDGFDLAFSAQRALSRNRVIHALGQRTFVAQCTLEKGGTWRGTVRNLEKRWSPVYCLEDGTEAVRRLIGMGAIGIRTEQLKEFDALVNPETNMKLEDFL